MLEGCQSVTHGCDGQEHGGHQQRRGHENQRAVLDSGHSDVEGGSRPVLVEESNEVGEPFRHGADSQQEWDFNKYDHQTLDAGLVDKWGGRVFLVDDQQKPCLWILSVVVTTDRAAIIINTHQLRRTTIR